MTHVLSIENNPYTKGYSGYCSCIDPQYEDGWEGYESFEGQTVREVEELHSDHVLEMQR